MSETAMEHLLSENAKLQVHITTLQSQSNSLTAQHTALQLANSQLVAEKEEVFMFLLCNFYFVSFISSSILKFYIYLTIMYTYLALERT